MKFYSHSGPPRQASFPGGMGHGWGRVVSGLGFLISAWWCPQALSCAPGVASSPVGQVVCSNGNAQFSCVVTGASLVFAWQVDGGGGFAAITNGGVYAGADTATLAVSGVTSALHSNQYRCVVTNTCGAVTTGVATLRVSAPPAASCAPATINLGNYGTGIIRVELNTIDNIHDDGNNDGLQDFTCAATTVLEPGSNYILTVTLDAQGEYCRVYIDYNDDGAFDAGELAMDHNVTRSSLHSETISIPVYPAVAEKVIRMRVISDYNTVGGGCDDVSYGEFEDYGLYILASPCVAPVIGTGPVQQVTCDGAVATFTCAATGPSLNYTWQVNYGAGFVNLTNGGIYSGAATATLTIPSVMAALNHHRYRCVVTNGCGVAISGEAELLAGVPASACSLATINTGNFGTGIIRVQFAGIDNAHNDDNNDGTQDFICAARDVVQAGADYDFTVTLYGSLGGSPEYCRIYIDYNNDGAFDAGEMVYNNNTTRQNVHTGTVTIPSTPQVTDALLRMRVISDFSTIAGGCNNVAYGEAEDYGIYIYAPTPQHVTSLAAPTPTNLVAYSAGPTNGSFSAEYTTNLVNPGAWQAVPGATSTWSNGTNITTFGFPANIPSAAVRLRDTP